MSQACHGQHNLNAPLRQRRAWAAPRRRRRRARSWRSRTSGRPRSPFRSAPAASRPRPPSGCCATHRMRLAPVTVTARCAPPAHPLRSTQSASVNCQRQRFIRCEIYESGTGPMLPTGCHPGSLASQRRTPRLRPGFQAAPQRRPRAAARHWQPSMSRGPAPAARAPDLAHERGLAPAAGQPGEHALVVHQLPDRAVPARLEQRRQRRRQQPAPVGRAHQRHQRLPEQPARPAGIW